MKTVGFVSLGCAKNLNDAEAMLGLLDQAGYKIVDNPDQAEILIVNTCTFIEPAKEESIEAILRMGSYKKEGQCKRLIVTGCLAQRYGEELQKEMPEIDGLLGTFSWDRVVELLDALEQKENQDHPLFYKDVKPLMYEGAMPRMRTGPSFSAYLKVAEGCSNGCSYCVIPSVRGAFRSRTIESVKLEAKSLAESGVSEINLIAQDTTSYGMDWAQGQPQLTALLKELEEMPETNWIRLLYCYPNRFTDELLEFMKTSKKTLPYVDMPLQHIDQEILKKMNRQDSENEVRELLMKIREALPNVALRTSLIVGFPGETEEQFEKLATFLEEFKFDHVGVFKYSQEESTPAAKMPDQISEEIKEERYHRLMAIQAKISEERNQSFEGQTLKVLIEGKHPEQENLWYGRSYREAPDVDGRVFVETDEELQVGTLVKARIDQGFAYDLVGILDKS
ncbi:MAG: 30S ribosomal protein S12 methylthiotransferase RimO [Negativicutes bacterium]|nr:30S ribosomal protein S12 methylthiotransferase RimO [Negativicutes bacterium]